MNKHGQTAIELAIFGTILVFVIGTLVSYALIFNYLQYQQMRIFRFALATSHQIDAQDSPILKRRSTFFVVIEDRSMPNLSSPFGIMRRSATGGYAGATYNRHLFAVAVCDQQQDLPVIDFIINGKHFEFTTAALQKIDDCQAWGTLCMGGSWFQKSMRGTDDYNNSAGGFYNLCRQETSDTYWEWTKAGTCKTMWEEGRGSADFDCDCKEETVNHIEVDTSGEYVIAQWLTYFDEQEGEIDFSINSKDIQDGERRQGLLPQETAVYRVEPGTLSRIEDSGKITTTLVTKRTDIISRVIQLNSNHQLSCGQSGELWAHVIAQTAGGNTVCDSEGCCETEEKKDKTCFDKKSFKFYVRSNLAVDKTSTWEITK